MGSLDGTRSCVFLTRLLNAFMLCLTEKEIENKYKKK